MSPRVRVLKDILVKFGEIGGAGPGAGALAAPLYLASTGAPAAAQGLCTVEPGRR